MRVKILSENGYAEALFGLGLSHGVTSGLDFEEDFEPQRVAWNMDEPDRTKAMERFNRMAGVANRLKDKGEGHDKFLRQICVWLDITAPRYWWPEMDQYKVATVTQSESTMHTIHKRMFRFEDFCVDGGIDKGIAQHLEYIRRDFMEATDKDEKKEYWRKLIQYLPQSYKQRRILTCNYATLRNIILQRTGHRLSEWAKFIESIRLQCEHPELLPA